MGDAGTRSSVALLSLAVHGCAQHLGKRLPSPEEHDVELPLRKPAAVFCGHGQIICTGIDHTFSRK